MLIPIIVVSVLALLLIFFLVKSAQNWNWVQITFTALIFLTGIFAAMAASQSLKTRYAWMERNRLNEERLAQVEKEVNELIYGPADAVSFGTGSLRAVNAELKLEQIGKGRVWTGGNPTVKDGQISVQFAGDGQSSPVQQITQDMLLYGFADGAAEIGDQTISVPLRFVGTFKVVSADGTSVNFEPVFVADDAEVAGPTSSWSFFEKMPGDDRDVFKLDLGMTKDNLDLSQYRQALKDTYMPAVQLGMDPSSEEYEALLDEYTFDGVARNLIDTWIAQQPDRINDRFEPEDRRLAVELELRNKSQEFTVDGSGNLGRDGVFNNEGEAIDPQLHLGNPVQIDNGQRITVDKLSGETGYKRADGTTDQEPLVSSEQAEVVNEYYVRELRDYPYLLQELGIQTKKLVDTKAAVDQAIKDTNELVADAEQQQDTRNEITAKLEDDIDKMRNDLNVVTELLRKRTLEYQQKQEQIRTYYKQIMEMYEESKRKIGDANRSDDDQSLAKRIK